jgi:hypothetical protein
LGWLPSHRRANPNSRHRNRTDSHDHIATFDRHRSYPPAALDNKDWAALASVFTETVDADFSAYGVPKGNLTRDALTSLFSTPFGKPELATEHIYSNFLIDVTGDTATSTFNFVGHHKITGFAGGDEFTLHAQYTDGLVRDPASKSWLIAKTTLRIFYMSGNPAILA